MQKHGHCYCAKVTKLMQSTSFWSTTCKFPTGEVVTFCGKIPSPIQITDHSNAEALLTAQRQRQTKHPSADSYKICVRSVTDDGHGANERTEKWGGLKDRPSRQWMYSWETKHCCSVSRGVDFNSLPNVNLLYSTGAWMAAGSPTREQC